MAKSCWQETKIVEIGEVEQERGNWIPWDVWQSVTNIGIPGICSSVLLFPYGFMFPLMEETERAKPGEVTTS